MTQLSEIMIENTKKIEKNLFISIKSHFNALGLQQNKEFRA